MFTCMRGKIGEFAVVNGTGAYVAPRGPRSLGFGQKAQPLDRQVRRRMIEPNLSGLSVSTQCALLSISRSSFYYEPRAETEMNLDLMRLIHCPAV